MFDKINIIKQKGYSPDVILDIGAHHGNWTNSMLQIFNQSKYYLFEAIDYPELNQFKNNDCIKVFNILLNDKIEQVNWYQMKNTGDSMFKEQTHHFNNCEILQKETNILIKIDSQGAEIPILKGSTSILEKTNFIILEIPFFGQYNEGVPNFLEHITFMNTIGFVVYDIIDTHYINNFNMQVDILFINKNHNFNRIVNMLLL
jgi:FkbM family methyltransferase